jgi:hypothetical protein
MHGKPCRNPKGNHAMGEAAAVTRERRLFLNARRNCFRALVSKFPFVLTWTAARAMFRAASVTARNHCEGI